MSIVDAPPTPGAAGRAPRGRVLARFGARRTGPTLICVGGLHGNEPAGIIALDRITARLEEADVDLRGHFLGLSGNLAALAESRRYIDEDLNRIWHFGRVEEIRGGRVGRSAEAKELRELERSIRDALEEADGRIFLLDIHTTSGHGPAFSVLDDTLPNRAFALALRVPLVLGIEEELGGTLASYLAAQGVTTAGFEAGQHDDTAAVERAEAAIWVALGASGLLGVERPEVAAARQRLLRHAAELPRAVEVRHRHPVAPGDAFQMEPGYNNFQRVAANVSLARDRRGTITRHPGGLILMPLYQEQGEDGFFLVRPVSLLWLRLSAALRRLQLDRFLHWLPGIRRHPSLPRAFVVDQRVARWFALELCHLLGLRRREHVGRYLVVSRRQHDHPVRTT